MKLNSQTYKLFILYWPIVMINYFLLMSTKINLTILLVDVPLVLFAYKSLKILNQSKRDDFVTFWGIFAVYVLFTVVAYAFNGTPIVCYFLGIQYYFVPLCFAPLGYYFSSDYKYNKSYLYACAICFAVGFFLYATLPPYYVSFLAEEQGYEQFGQDELFGITRFSSFLPGSYNISFLSVPALILSLSYSVNQNAGIKKRLCFLIASISFVAAIICQQRIAMFFAVFVVLFYSFYLSRHGNRTIVFVAIGVIVILALIINNYVSEMPFYDALQESVLGRFEKMDVSVALSERTGQYSTFNRATWWSYIVGLGMGSCGHLVIPYHLQAIYDGEFVKTFYEFGLIGTSLFTILTIMTLLRGVKLFRYLHSEVLIMLFFLGACVGASALTFFIYNSMFWFAMGRIWNKNYLALRKQEMARNIMGKNKRNNYCYVEYGN